MTPRRPPLDGVRIIEFGCGLATPLAARLLGDMGAEVIKVEPEEGDRTRKVKPAYVTEDGDERSALFEYLNFNKFGVVLDPDRDRTELAALIGSADAVLVGDDIAQLGFWEVDPDQLLELHPDLVAVTLTPFGITGAHASWRATDLILQAASGLMSFGGTRDRSPLKRGLRQAIYESGITAAYVATAALFAARRGRGGAVVDVSMAECVTSELVLTVPEYTFTGAISARRPPVVDPFASGEPLAAGDGYVSAQINTITPASAFADFIGDPRLAEARFQTPEGRATNAEDIAGIFEQALADVEPRDFFQRASALGLLVGFVQTAGQLLECPHLEARNVFRDMPGTLNGRPWKMPMALASLSATPAGLYRAAPVLGEHNAMLVGEMPRATT